MNFGLFGTLGQLSPTANLALDRSEPFKGVGYLGLPKPALAQVGLSHCYQSRVFRLFSEVNRAREKIASLASELKADARFTEHPVLAALLDDFLTSNSELTNAYDELHSDARIVALNGTMISTGSGGIAFEESRLQEWYLWCANEFGPEVTKQRLNEWLNAEEVDVVNTLWVYGLDVDDEIQLGDGYRITPAERLPDSTHKEQALQFKMPTFGDVVAFPTVAITRICRVKKALPAGQSPNWKDDTDFWKSQQRLYDIAIVLNTLPGVACVPAFATSYSLETNPFGPFGGAGGGMHLYDVVGRRQTKISQECHDDVQSTVNDFAKLSDKEKERFRRILSRLSQGKRRSEIADKVMDLGITLEMLLLKDNPNREQLALAFRLRGAWLISATPEERVKNYRLLKELYTYRSHVAHSGLLEDGNPKKIAKVSEQFPTFQALAEKICRRLLKNPNVDWEGLLIDGAGGNPDGA